MSKVATHGSTFSLFFMFKAFFAVSCSNSTHHTVQKPKWRFAQGGIGI